MTFFVGIDIAKYNHFACIINLHGEIIVEPFEFSNSSDGFSKLLHHLHSFSNDNVVIGFESTSHYHQNLAYFLKLNAFSFELINPILTKRFRGLNIRDVKNDKVDSLTIATFLAMNRSNYINNDFIINELAFLSKERDNLIKQRSTEYVRLTAYLDRVFPELKQRCKASIKTHGFHNLLKKYSTAHEIKKTRIDALYNTLNFKGKYFPMHLVEEIKNLAKGSIGFHSNALSAIIKGIIHQIEFLNKQIDIVEKELKSHPLVSESRLNQLRGMGLIQIAYILSAIQNISRFDSPCQVLAYAGLDPKVRQSGQFSATNTRMSKRGNYLLRYALIWSANNIRKNSKTMNEYYLKKRSEGKSHYNALGHCAKKVVNYIFFILNNPDKDFILE
jgi:transposase